MDVYDNIQMTASHNIIINIIFVVFFRPEMEKNNTNTRFIFILYMYIVELLSFLPKHN